MFNPKTIHSGMKVRENIELYAGSRILPQIVKTMKTQEPLEARLSKSRTSVMSCCRRLWADVW